MCTLGYSGGAQALFCPSDGADGDGDSDRGDGDDDEDDDDDDKDTNADTGLAWGERRRKCRYGRGGRPGRFKALSLVQTSCSRPHRSHLAAPSRR